MLHNGAWVATLLLGTLLGVQDYKNVKFTGRENSSLAGKGLNKNVNILKKSQNFMFFWLFNPSCARSFTDFR